MVSLAKPTSFVEEYSVVLHCSINQFEMAAIPLSVLSRLLELKVLYLAINLCAEQGLNSVGAGGS